MASLSDDTLRKVVIRATVLCSSTLSCIMSQILVQIQQTAVQSQRALSITRQQVANKERERRILQLTVSEIGQIEHSANVYKGVGKMC